MNRRTLETSALALLGLGIGANAVLGPLVLNVIRFHISSLMENQLLGGELVSLLLVAPAVIFFRLVRALTHSERFGNADFGRLVGDLKQA